MAFKKGDKGHLGFKHSMETRKKISNSMKNCKVWNKGITSNLDQRLIKCGNRTKNHIGLKGKIQTEQAKEKLRIARVNQIIPTKNTSIEIKIRNLLILNKIPFIEQKPLINRTIVDFFIEPNICIYCDGTYWHSLPKTIIRDKKINEILDFLGYKVIRLNEDLIKKDINKCMEIISLGR